MRIQYRSTLAAFLSLAALTSATSTHAQSPVTTWAQSYGVGDYEPDGSPSPNMIYPTSGNDLATGIAPMPDGGVVVCGRLNLPETNTNRQFATNDNGLATLVRYAPNGTILWQQALRQSNDSMSTTPDTQLVATNTVYQVLTDAQGNIFTYLNQSEHPGGGSDNIVVAKFSPEGALIWQNGFAGDKFSDGATPPTVRPGGPATGGKVSFDNSFSLTADGGVILAAAEYAPLASITFPFYVKFNADGSLGVHRPFKNISQYPGFRAAAQSVNGSRILASSNSSGTVLLTDAASGQLLAERTFHSDAGVFNYPQDIIVRALPLADNGFLLLGLDQGQYGQGLTLHRVDANLVPVWSKVLQNITGTNLAPTGDGGYLLTGTTNTNETATDVLLLKVDANGNPVFARGIGGPKDEGYNGAQGQQVPMASAVQTTDGGYAFTASSFSYTSDALAHPDFWTVKTDANGHVLNFSGRETDIALSTFQAHDNTLPSEVTSTYDGSYPDGYIFDAATVTFGVVPENLAANTGINKPTTMSQAAPTVSYNHQLLFTGETPLGSGVYYLQFASSGSPFGYYSYLADSNYIYHFDLGYEYVFDANDGNAGVYLYDFKSGGFFYTAPGFPFPYLYDFSLNTVLYYYPDPNRADRYNTDGTRYFYRFDTAKIITK